MDDFNKLIIKLINSNNFKLRIIDFYLKKISFDIQEKTYQIQFFKEKDDKIIEFDIWCDLENDFIKYKTFENLNDLLVYFKNKNLLEEK